MRTGRAKDGPRLWNGSLQAVRATWAARGSAPKERFLAGPRLHVDAYNLSSSAPSPENFRAADCQSGTESDGLVNLIKLGGPLSVANLAQN